MPAAFLSPEAALTLRPVLTRPFFWVDRAVEPLRYRPLHQIRSDPSAYGCILTLVITKP